MPTEVKKLMKTPIKITGTIPIDNTIITNDKNIESTIANINTLFLSA